MTNALWIISSTIEFGRVMGDLGPRGEQLLVLVMSEEIARGEEERRNECTITCGLLHSFVMQ